MGGTWKEQAQGRQRLPPIMSQVGLTRVDDNGRGAGLKMLGVLFPRIKYVTASLWLGFLYEGARYGYLSAGPALVAVCCVAWRHECVSCASPALYILGLRDTSKTSSGFLSNFGLL